MLFTEVTREEYGDIREQEGREDGIEIGRADGIELGRADGIEQKALESAQNLKNKGIPDEVIAECVGLPLERVKALVCCLQK